MPLEGEYEPSPQQWVRDQVARYEETGGREANTLLDTGLPVAIFSTRGARSGKVRKQALMRVEHDGAYALVASQGGAPSHPFWYWNIVAEPHVMVQDKDHVGDYTAREVTGAERDEWWARAVSVFPDYGVYQEKTDRTIPVFVAEPRA